jgi:hypothetical protein
METKDELDKYFKDMLAKDPHSNTAIAYQSLIAEIAKMTGAKTLLETLDLTDNRITIKNLNKILTLSVKNKSMIKLFSAEEIGAFGNVYEFKGIIDKQDYVFDLHRTPDKSVGSNYFTLALTYPQKDSVLIQKESIDDPMKLISVMEQLIMNNKPLIN